MNLSKLIAFDIGNSRLKAFDGSELVAIEYGQTCVSELKEYLRAYDNIYAYAALSAVNASKKDIFLELISDLDSFTLIEAKELLSQYAHFKYDHISGIGSDRLLGLQGALQVSPAPVITIDCGTAITVNCINKDSVCVGGAIMPGAYTQLLSLTEHTDLNVPRNLTQTPAAGKTTNDAILSGIVHGISGAIERITNLIIKEELNGEQPEIYLTGGYAKEIEQLLNLPKVRRNDLLVLRGLYHLLRMHVKSI